MNIKYKSLLTVEEKEQEREFELHHFKEEYETEHDFVSILEEKYASIPILRVLAYQDEEIIGRVLLFKRVIPVDSVPVLFGGIGTVCTHKQLRRKGIATKLIKISLELLKKERCDVIFLCTDIKKYAAFYSKFHFVPLNRAYIFQGVSGKEYTAYDGMIAPGISLEKFNKILHSSSVIDLHGCNW